MRLLGQQDAAITQLGQRLHNLTRELIKDLEAAGPSVNRTGYGDALAGLPGNQVFLVKEGELHCCRDGQPVYLVQAGDLIGLGRSVQLPDGEYVPQSSVELVPYSRSALLAHANSSDSLQKNWAFYLVCWGSFFSACLAQVTPRQLQPSTGFMHFEPGEFIIRQGEAAECVYTLLEGAAEVLHNGVKVGDVQADQVFGAMSVFTHQPRSADVRAVEACSVLAVKEADFLTLVSQQPQMGVTLIKQMAEQINQLNSQVHDLQT